MNNLILFFVFILFLFKAWVGIKSFVSGLLASPKRQDLMK